MGPEGMRQAGWGVGFGRVCARVCVYVSVCEEIKRNDWPGLLTSPSANQNPRLSPFANAAFDGIQ